jgi:hypothetical protein
VFERDSAPPKIVRISPDGLAAQKPELRGGLQLQSVQGTAIAGLQYAEILDAIKRPRKLGHALSLTFIDPEQTASAPPKPASGDTLEGDAEEARLKAEMNSMVAATGAEEEEQEELDEEMEELREEYVMGIMSNCQSCLDPISGERLLVADLSYTVRRLNVTERFNLRNENELSDSSEDNQLFERRSGNTLAERSLKGAAGDYTRAGEDGGETDDGATVLLTGGSDLAHVVVLGAPACGKTTLLQKMRYWAAITAYQDEAKPIPVFVYLVGFAKFIMNGGECDLLAYLKSSSPADQYRVIADAHRQKTVLYLLDGLDECAQMKEQLQMYIASTLKAETARVVLSSRLAGFSDDHLADGGYEFVQLELCSTNIQKVTAKRRLTEGEYDRFEQMMSTNPMFALYATTPLALSLLIELFRSGKLDQPTSGAQRAINKGELYRAGMVHMLDVGARLQKYTTDECASAFIEANDFPRLDYSYKVHKQAGYDCVDTVALNSDVMCVFV